MRQKICVVHLVWVPYGIKLFKEFIDSYKSHPAGFEHDLVLLFNGIKNESEVDLYHKYIQQNNIQYKSYYHTKGQDLEVYRWIAKQLTCEYIFFVNSFSRFTTNNWLKKFSDANSSNVGVISATGSWQSHYSNVFEKFSWKWASNDSLEENITKYKLLLKAFFLWRFYFKPFPNPHIRTNSFFIRRSLFIDLKYQNPKTKFDAYRIESGRNSITQQILTIGLDVLVIDKFGKTYKAMEWNNAHIFWSGNQENTIITDNQTSLYDIASVEEKFKLSYFAWHNFF